LQTMEPLRKSKVIYLAVLFLAATCTNAYGQQAHLFKYKAGIQQIDSSGVYRVELTPGFIAKTKDDLSDIRLIDNTGKNIAYVLSNKLTLDNPDSFIVFSGIAVDTKIDTSVIYIAENKNTLDISQLWIKLKNTDVDRTVNLSGSDDLKKWFAIKEDIPLEEAGGVNQPDYRQSITFPASNYRYFRIEVNGKNKTPVKILQAGIYTKSLDKPVFLSLPALKFIAKENGKVTSVFIDIKEPYLYNKLHFDIAAPKYYSRKIIVYANDKKRPISNVDDPIADTILSSSGLQDVILSVKSRHLRIDIFNGDDNALNIKSIAAYQLKIYAVCYLESGHKYVLYTGNSSAAPAVYDLSFLNNRAYDQLPSINQSPVDYNPVYAASHPFVQADHPIWLWSMLILVLLVLCFFTLKMVREIK